jgi:hypothetical protein
MASVTSIDDFLTKLRTALMARQSLAGVAIYSASVEPESLGTKSILLAAEKVEADYRYRTLPRKECWEDYTVRATIEAVVPGAGETQIAAARSAVLGLLEELHDYLSSLNGTAACVSALGVDDASITAWSLDQGVTASRERICRLEVRIAVSAHFTPS